MEFTLTSKLYIRSYHRWSWKFRCMLLLPHITSRANGKVRTNLGVDRLFFWNCTFLWTYIINDNCSLHRKNTEPSLNHDFKPCNCFYRATLYWAFLLLLVPGTALVGGSRACHPWNKLAIYVCVQHDGDGDCSRTFLRGID